MGAKGMKTLTGLLATSYISARARFRTEDLRIKRPSAKSAICQKPAYLAGTADAPPASTPSKCGVSGTESTPNPHQRGTPPPYRGRV